MRRLATITVLAPLVALPTQAWECFSPREWQPKLFDTVMDENRNFIHDALDALPPEDVVDVVVDRGIMDQVWAHAADPGFAYRRIFDARLATTLRHHGVSQFATVNEKDFIDFGFELVWNPLDD